MAQGRVSVVGNIMVGVVVGSRLGLEQTSGYVLGARGQLGSSTMGRAGENVFVNAATGNLILNNRDEFLVGLGPNSSISRTYNSQGQFDGDNNDGWRVSATRRVSNPTGTPNTAGSTVTRTDWDGSQVLYTWNDARDVYLTTEGVGAYDSLEKVGTEWIWTDGDSQVTETYGASGTDNWRLLRQTDTDGNSVLFTYNTDGYISRVATARADGTAEYTDMVYVGANLTELKTTYYDDDAHAFKTRTRTRYAYDGLNRLSSVTVDLSPNDNTLAGGGTYVTSYTYAGTSTRVASISQTDGSRIDIAYESAGAYRVTSIVQTVATGVTRSTDFVYFSTTETHVTGPDGLTTKLTYTTKGELTRIVEPAATAGGAAQEREFTYDDWGNVRRIKTSPTTWTEFRYFDTDGDGVANDYDGDNVRDDHNGLWTRQYQRQAENVYLAASRTYNARDAVLTETRYLSVDTNISDDVLPGDPLTTRYVYDSENHLRYTISPTGSVVQYDYTQSGLLNRTIAYTAASYDVTSLPPTASVSLSLMNSWAAALPNPSAAEVTETVYDYRGQIDFTAAYSTNNPTGGANGGGPTTRIYHQYDAFGRLVSRRVAGMPGTETFVYDGMDRMVAAVDFDGNATTTAFYDVLGTTLVRLANGLNQISTFNRAGERLSYTETERGADIINATGWPMGEPPGGAAGVAGWPSNPAYAADSRWSWTMVNGPNGRQVVAMETGQIQPGENGGGAYTNSSPIDGNKAYEYVFYFRKADLTRHSLYFGMNEHSGGQAYVENATTGADNPNPYFLAWSPAVQQASIDDDRWYKVVAYVLPQGSALVAAGALGGVYDAETGAKVGDVNNFRWNDTRPNDQAYARFFNYYDQTNVGYSTYFLKPEVREVPTNLLNTPTTPATQYRYDRTGRLRTVIDPTGKQSHVLYDRVGRKVADIDADGSLVEYRYDLADRLVATTRYATWLTAAQVASLTDTAGNPTNVELSSLRPAANTADSWTWQVHDDAGRLTRTVDGTGAVVSYSYDGASRLVQTTAYATRLAIGNPNSFDPAGAISPSEAADRVVRNFFDGDGRQIGTLDAEGFLTQIHYDHAGRVVQTSAFRNATALSDLNHSELRVTGTFFDLKDSITKDQDRDIHTWSFYDGRGFLKASVNGEGEVTLYEYTPLGHVAQTIRGRKIADVPTTTPTLDLAQNAPATVLEITTYTRNHLGQVLTEAKALADGVETITYSYDGMHRLVATFTDRTATTGPDYETRQRYDLRGRMVSQLTGRGVQALGSNPNTTDIENAYRRWGVNYAYDEAGRLISKTDPDGTNGPGNKTTYFYDADGNLAYEVNGGGEVVGYAYDAMNRRVRTIAYLDHVPASTLAGLTGGSIPTSLQTASWSRTTPPSSASVTTLVYSVRDEVVDLINPLGLVEHRIYDAFGDLRGVTTPTGPTVSANTVTAAYNYDRRGSLLETYRDITKLDDFFSMGYDAFGRVLSSKDNNDKGRSTTYDRVGRAKTVYDAFGHPTTYEYDARGNVLSVTDRLRNKTEFTHDAFNRTQTVKTPSGLITTTTTDDLGHTLQVTDGGGRITNYTYDVDGNLVTTTNGLGQQISHAYNEAGLISNTVDATGRRVVYTYDAANRIQYETVDPEGLNLVTTYIYDTHVYDGVKLRRNVVIDPSGVRTDYAFDPAGRLIKVSVDPSGLNLRTEFSHDRAGNVISLREGVGTDAARETLYDYDKLNRLVRQWNGDLTLYIETRYSYDRNDNVVLRIDRVSEDRTVTTRYAYDAENRLAFTVDAAGGVTRNIYDAEGRIVRTIAYATALTPAQIAGIGEGPLTASQLEALVAARADDQSTVLAYDTNGRLTFRMDALGQVTRTEYDGSNNVVRRTDFTAAYTAGVTPSETQLMGWASGPAAVGARVSRAVFDAANRQTFVINALDEVTAVVHDGAGRVLSSTQFVSTDSVPAALSQDVMAAWASSNLHTGNRTTRMAYDGAGRATFVIDAEGYVRRTVYRPDGQVEQQVRYTPVLTVATGVTHAALDGLLADHEAAASRTKFGYDTAGRNIAVTDAEGVETIMMLDALGQVKELIQAAGTLDQSKTIRAYDDAGRMTSEIRAYLETGVQATSSWSYDALGRVTKSVDGRGSSTEYTHDNLGRVLTKKVPLGIGKWATTTNTYDTFGNVTSVTDPRSAIGYFEYDGLNRLVKQTDPLGYITLTAYSRGGEITSVTRAGATTVFERDKLDRLKAVIDAEGHVESYELDAFGDRVRVFNRLGEKTVYQYDRRGLKKSELLPITSLQGNGTFANVVNLFEYDARGNLTKTIEAASLGEARTTFYVYDKLDRLIEKRGDTVVVTDANNFITTTSTQTETITYDDRGNITQTINAAGARTLFYYDDLNRKIGEIDALGTVRTWSYDQSNNVTSAKIYDNRITLPLTAGGTLSAPSGNKRETLYSYDLANRLTHTTVQSLRTGQYISGGFVTTDADVTTENIYDDSGNIVQIIDGQGVSTYAFYDKLGRQTARVDGEGYLTTWSRDAEGNATREVRYADRVVGPVVPYINDTSPGRDQSTLPPRTMDAAAGDRITEFGYDANGRRLSETRIGVQVYSAGAPDRLITINSTINYTYDGLGNITRRVEANGDYTDFGYDALGRQTREMGTAFVTHLGQTVRRQTDTRYNGLGQVTRVAEDAEAAFAGNERVTTFTYGAGGRLASMTDPTDFIRFFAHDAMGRVVRESYDRMQGNDVAVTEARRYGYDLLGRLTLESSASLGSVWTFGDRRTSDYNAHGEVTARKLNDVVQETFDYDEAGRVWRSTAGDGVVKHTMYDKAGRMTLTVLPVGNGLPDAADIDDIEDVIDYLTNNGSQPIGGQPMATATLTYSLHDRRGLLLGTREPHRELARDFTTSAVTIHADITRSRAYNAFGEVISETDARGFTTDFTYNVMGRLIEQRSPEVQLVNEQGVTTHARPTQQYRYDISGRLIASRTANGYWSSRTLVAGTGHGQTEAIVASETAADGGVMTYGVDVFGDIRKITNQLGFVTEQDFDKAGRLVTVKHPERAANTPGNGTRLNGAPSVPVRLIDNYEYDGLGQRIVHWNNQFGIAHKERTVYDREGRVTSQIDLDNRETKYSYTWDASIKTGDLGIFGGWEKKTTHVSGKIGTERLDSFGRLTGKTDLGNRTYAMGFDKAGRQISQTSGAPNSGSATGSQSLTMSWYNTGLLARQSDSSGNAQTYSTANAQADYTYDAAGNRLRERYVTTTWTYDYNPIGGAWNPYDETPDSPPTVQELTTVHQDGWATYDKLGRMTEFRDTAVSAADPMLTTYTYDLNDNLRSTSTRYRRVETDAATSGGHVYWYAYDAMDRFVHAQYSVNNGSITGGTQFLYDVASNRRQAITYENVNIVVSEEWEFVGGPGIEPVAWDGQMPPPDGYQLITRTRPVVSPRVEYYDYTADGYLAQVSQAVGEWDPNAGPDGMGGVALGAAVRYAHDMRDAMGRVVERLEYADGTTITHSRVSEYSRAGLIEREFTRTFTDMEEQFTDYFTESVVTYDYRLGTGTGATPYSGDWQGVVTRVRTTSTKVNYNGTLQTQPTSQTNYTHSWWDSALQARIAYDANIGDSTGPKTSTFAYDVNGRVSYVSIDDGRPRTVTFVTDSAGQVLTRREADRETATGDPFSQYVYFNGQRIGEITNDATFTQRSYAAAVISRTAPPPSSASKPFQNGVSNNPVHGASFDYGYDALRPDSVPASGQAWTVRDGDTLQGIAAAVWGDAALWYIIAEHNGLTGTSILTAGQSLTVPARVANLHNTSETFRPYDPNKALGDLNPTQPAPPKKGNKGCGVVGQIVAVVIAAVIIAATKGQGVKIGLSILKAAGVVGTTTTAATATAAVAATAKVIGTAVIAAGANAASQGFLIATGAQDSFDWKQLGISAISAGVNVGLDKANIFSGSGFVQGAARGATASVITQGVSVATGLQNSFSWTNVGVSAVIGGFDGQWGERIGNWAFDGVGGGKLGAQLFDTARGTASALVGATARSIITGDSFGDNLIAVLPDVIGSTIGNTIGGRLAERAASAIARREDAMAASDAAYPAAALVGDRVGATAGPGSQFAGSNPFGWFFDGLRNVRNGLSRLVGGGSPAARQGTVNEAPVSAPTGDPETYDLGEVVVNALGGLGMLGRLSFTRAAREGASEPRTIYVPNSPLDPNRIVYAGPTLADMQRSMSRGAPYNAIDRAFAGRDWVAEAQARWAPTGNAMPSLQDLENSLSAGVSPSPSQYSTGPVEYRNTNELALNRYVGGQTLQERGLQRFRDSAHPARDPLGRIVDVGAGLLDIFAGAGEKFFAPAAGTMDYAGQVPQALTGNAIPATYFGDLGMTAASLWAGQPQYAATRAGARAPIMLTTETTLVDLSRVSDLAPGFYRANPSQLRFSQSTVSPNFGSGGTIDDLISDLNMGLSPDQVRGGPLQVVMRDGIPFSIDNRRLVAFNAAGVRDIPIEIVSLRNPRIAERFFERFDPISGQGNMVVVVPTSARPAAQQLLYDYGLIKRMP